MDTVFESTRAVRNRIVNPFRPERLLHVERFEHDPLHRALATHLDLQNGSVFVEEGRHEFDGVG